MSKASTGAFTLAGDSSASSAADWFFSNASSTVKDFDDDGVLDEHNNNAIGVFSRAFAVAPQRSATPGATTPGVFVRFRFFRWSARPGAQVYS
jgi:hypothetical protein